MDAGRLIGKSVALDRDAAPLAPCKWCGFAEGNIRPGAGQHKAQIRCNGCDRSLGWLSAQWIDYLLKRGGHHA